MANNIVIDSRWRKQSSIEERYIKSEDMALFLANRLQELNIESEPLFHRPDGITVTRIVSNGQAFEVHEYDDFWYAKCEQYKIFWPFVHAESDLDGPATFLNGSNEFSGLSNNRFNEMIEFIRKWSRQQ